MVDRIENAELPERRAGQRIDVVGDADADQRAEEREISDADSRRPKPRPLRSNDHSVRNGTILSCSRPEKGRTKGWRRDPVPLGLPSPRPRCSAGASSAAAVSPKASPATFACSPTPKWWPSDHGARASADTFGDAFDGASPLCRRTRGWLPTPTWTRCTSPRRTTPTGRPRCSPSEVGKHVLVDPSSTVNACEAEEPGPRWRTGAGAVRSSRPCGRASCRTWSPVPGWNSPPSEIWVRCTPSSRRPRPVVCPAPCALTVRPRAGRRCAAGPGDLSRIVCVDGARHPAGSPSLGPARRSPGVACAQSAILAVHQRRPRTVIYHRRRRPRRLNGMGLPAVRRGSRSTARSTAPSAYTDRHQKMDRREFPFQGHGLRMQAAEVAKAPA